jgi:Ca2+-binding RTX toxin-like protein
MPWVLKFWKTFVTPPQTPVTWNFGHGTPPADVPVPQVTDITNYINSIAALSTLAASRLNAYGEDIRIGYEAGNVGEAFRGTLDKYILIDVAAANTMYFFNTFGELVAGDLRLTIMHELAHNYLPGNDPSSTANEATLNGADFDVRGAVINEQNAIALNAGLTGQVQTSYYGALLSIDPLFNLFATNSSYSDGNLIDNARYGSLGADSIDHGNNTKLLNDLLFGLGGDDTIKSGKGNDYIYGGEGQDKIWGGDGDDVLMGDDAKDELRGEKGNDTIWGGAKGAETGRSDGVDTVFYDTAAAGITITLGGSTLPTLTVSDGEGGTDTLHSIEIIQGSNHNDKLILQGLTSQISAAFDYIDLGGGDDIVDIAGLVGSVTVDLTLPQNQTVTFGGAVLKLKNVEHVTGNNSDDIITPSTAAATTITLGSGNDVVHLVGSGHSISAGLGYDLLSLSTVVTGSRIHMASGAATIRGTGTSSFAGFEEVVGSDGGAFLYGDGRGTRLVGGAGANYLEGRGADILVGGSGDTYFALSKGATAISGAGNDYFEASGADPVTIVFGAGSGHDMLASYLQPGGPGINNDSWIASRQNDMIWLQGLSKNDIELIWNYTEVGGVSAGAYGNFDDFYRTGEAAIRIKAAGETLYLGELAYDKSDYMAWYEVYFTSLFSRDYDKALARLASGAPTGYGPGHTPTWAAYTTNDNDNDAHTVELAIFSFDGVNRLNIFDLFDLSTISSQALPADTKAGAGVLSHLAGGGGDHTAVGTAGADTMAGGSADDDLFSGDGNDTVDGGAGNDVVRAGAGDDLILGGAGNDNYDGGSGSDTVGFSATSSGVLVDFAGGTASGTQIGNDTLVGIENAIGGSGNDYFYFGATFTAANKIVGGAGTDTVGLLGTYNLTLGANTLSGVETLSLLSGTAAGGTTHVTYSITTVDSNVPAGGREPVLQRLRRDRRGALDLRRRGERHFRRRSGRRRLRRRGRRRCDVRPRRVGLAGGRPRRRPNARRTGQRSVRLSVGGRIDRG